jgi:carboxyl-terminal processing protease
MNAILLALLSALSAAGGSSPEQPSATLPLEEIRRFAAVFRAVERDFVDEVDRERLMRAAIRGILSELDPYSEYLEGEALEDLAEATEGAYVGVGIELIQREDGRIGVLAAIDGGPAARAGVRPGDVLAAIDGEGVPAGAGIDRVVARLRGKPGSEVGLTLEREDHEGALMVRLKRERIQVRSVRAEGLPDGVAYLRISQFQIETARELRRAVERLSRRLGRTPSAAIIDLRNNPGGLLQSAVEVADLFLEEGVVVSVAGRNPAHSAQFSASPGDLLQGAPIVVLIDLGTASAAEIVAAALRDHGRARLLGQPSFGKGSVQTLLPLSEREAVKLTTARFHAPSGRPLDGQGLEPDQRIGLAEGQPASALERDPAVAAALAWLRSSARRREDATPPSARERDG